VERVGGEKQFHGPDLAGRLGRWQLPRSHSQRPRR
jgi:hypothetical protein